MLHISADIDFILFERNHLNVIQDRPEVKSKIDVKKY